MAPALSLAENWGPVRQLLAIEKEAAGPTNNDQARYFRLLSRHLNVFRARQRIDIAVRIIPARVEGTQHHVVAGQSLCQGPMWVTSPGTTVR